MGDYHQIKSMFCCLLYKIRDSSLIYIEMKMRDFSGNRFNNNLILIVENSFVYIKYISMFSPYVGFNFLNQQV